MLVLVPVGDQGQACFHYLEVALGVDSQSSDSGEGMECHQTA